MNYFFFAGKKLKKIGKAKKRSIRRFFVLLFLPVLIASCTGSLRSKGAEGAVRFETLKEKRTILLLPEKEGESPRMNIRLSLADPEKKGDGKEAALIREVLYGGMEVREYAEDLIRAKTEDYKAMEEIEGEDGSLNWEYSEVIEPLKPFSRLLVFSRSREYYTGGAHGMGERKFFVVDPGENRQVRLEDFIRPDALPALGELLEAALRSHAGLDPGAALSEGGFFTDAVEAPDNYFPLPQGLGFHWDPYEIAPYVMGPIQIIIPWEEVRPLLAPAYQQE